MALLRGRKDKPTGLMAGMVNSWLNGSCASAKREHLEYVLALWEQAVPVVEISEAIRYELLQHKGRTRVSAIALLRLDPN